MKLNRATVIRKVQAKIVTDKNSVLSKAYFIHAVKYGDYIDIRTYYDAKITFKNRDRNTNKSKTGDKRSDSLSRARIGIYRLIHANAFKHGQYRPIFTTYTFAKQCSDITEANKNFRLFVKRLEYHTCKKLKYICIPEIQKEREKKEGVGVWHFHVIWFNLPWIDYRKHEKVWSHGWSQIEQVRSIQDLGSYVAKYLSKDIFEKRLYGKKTYYTSRGLFRPVDFFTQREIDNVFNICNPELIGYYEGGNFVQKKYKLN